MTRPGRSLIGAPACASGRAVNDAIVAEIEAALLSSGLLNAAAVTAHQGSQGDTILVAHVVPCAPAEFRPILLQEYLQDVLPDHPVPSRFVALDALPIRPDGEIDREALLERHPQSGVFSTAAMIAATYDPLTAQLATIWGDLLGVALVLPDDDFFDLGGNSLRAARLCLLLADVYRVRIPVHTLYEARTLRSFAAIVHRALREDVTAAATGAEPHTWAADARLPADVRATIIATSTRERAPADAWRAGEVFLTGGTGFLGAFVLRELLTSTSACVHCLVRARDPASGLLRLRLALSRYGLWHDAFARRIHVIPGDLAKPRFGLDASSFEALAYTVDIIFHCAAHTNLIAPYSTHRAVNVGGTAEVLRLAATGLPKPVHHVSSIAVFGPTGVLGGVERVHEDDELDNYVQYLRFDTGYAASKWVAEKMVWEAARAGLPVTVHRLGYLVGDSRTGACNPDDLLGRIVRTSVRIGVYPDLPRQRMEFVPVDFASRALVHIAGRANHQGLALHLVPPDPRLSLDLHDFFALIATCGFRLSRVTYPQWLECVLEDARCGDSPLTPLLPFLSERVYKDELTRWELHENSPAFDAVNTVWALSGSDIDFHPLDRSLLVKYLRHWLPAGAVPVRAAAGAHRSGRLLVAP
ncbi:MAG TPA: thioester reductase domain-containing protein [Nannocystis sp.]